MNFKSKNDKRDLLISIIKHPFCFPGGYDRAMILTDGALLCACCVKKEAKRIMSDIRDGYSTGWMPAATCYEGGSLEWCQENNQELISQCDQCGKEFGELC